MIDCSRRLVDLSPLDDPSDRCSAGEYTGALHLGVEVRFSNLEFVITVTSASQSPFLNGQLKVRSW